MDDAPSFARPNWFDAVGVEARTAQTQAVLADVSHGATFRVTGRGAADFLGRVFAVDLPVPGQSAQAVALTPHGTFAAEAELISETPERFVLSTASVAENYMLDLLQKHLPGQDVRIDTLTGREGALLLFG